MVVSRANPVQGKRFQTELLLLHRSPLEFAYGEPLFLICRFGQGEPCHDAVKCLAVLSSKLIGTLHHGDSQRLDVLSDRPSIGPFSFQA